MTTINFSIQNDKGQPLAGYLIYIDSSGSEITRTQVPVGGLDTYGSDPSGTIMYRISADGYKWIQLSAVPEPGSIVTLHEKEVSPLMWLLGIGVVLFIGSKL